MSSAGGVHASQWQVGSEQNRWIPACPGSWGVVLGEVILTKAAFRGEVQGEAVGFVVVENMLFAISTCNTCSWKVGVTLHPPARLTVDHPCLSVMLPLASMSRCTRAYDACAGCE